MLMKSQERPKIRARETGRHENRYTGNDPCTCFHVYLSTCLRLPYAFPNTIASNAILTYNPYSI